MGVTDEGIATAEAGAGAPIDIGAMKSILIVGVVLVEDMMIGSTIMKVIAGGIGVQALDIGRDEVEALGGGVNEARLGKAVRRGVLKLHNGIGKGSSRKKQPIIMSMLTAATMTTGKCKMAAVKNISSTYHRSKENMHTDIL